MSPAFAPLKCAQGSSQQDQIQQNRIQQTKETAIMEAGSTRQDFPSDPEKRAQEAQQPQLPEPTPTALTQEQLAQQQEEQKLIRRLQMMMNMVLQVIAQDRTLTVDDASQMIADSKKAALAMFPGKELAYDLIWKPRFQRLMRERFRIM
jgi:type IV secretory pathway VirB10-like protein